MDDFELKMKEKIKQYSNKQYLDGYIQNEFLTEDGDADIFLSLSSKDDLFDTRTVHNQKDLRHDVYEFIEEKSSMLDNNVLLNLHIVGVELSSKEQGIVKHILKEHYAIELYKVQKEYIKYRNKIISLIMIGFISLFSYLLLYLNTNFNFFLEVLGFLFSFSLWEAFDCMIYAFSDVKSTREAITQNLLMNVEFNDESEKKDISQS